MLRKAKKALVIPMCLMIMSVTAMAGNSLEGYNTTVGRLNGSGYSGSQEKVTSGANGRIVSKSVGGNYTVDVRMQKTDGSASGPWYRGLNDNMDTGYNVGGHVNQKNKDKVRLQFSNDLTTPVDVQVSGSWCSQ